jgi:two-component system OmpR family response regulator
MELRKYIKVLVVDDNVDFLNLMVKHLDRKGCEVTGFVNPREALEELNNNRFHVLVSDWLMPEMSGNKLAMEAKKIDKSMQIILITSHVKMGEIGVLGFGAFAQLNKPLSSMLELSEAVFKAYEHRKQLVSTDK